MANILIIDDERSVRNTLREMLEYEGHQVEGVEDDVEGYLKARDGDFDLVLCDYKYVREGKLPHPIAEVRAENPTLQIIITFRDPDIETVVECMKQGANDFVTKPFDLNRLMKAVKDCIEQKAVPTTKRPAAGAKAKSGATPFFDSMKGNTPQIQHVKRLIEKVAPSEARVLILGDNGTGKELVAHSLHEKSGRSRESFVAVNCAAIPSDLIESALFGHEKGAFTSAVKQHIGKFEQADGGTIFLDEIGDMSLEAQAKVLRALQEGRISRVGSDKDIEVNVRVIAATNKNLHEEIEQRNFREDLYHRLSVIVIRVPSLSERKEDIPELVETFLDELCAAHQCERKTLDPEALNALMGIEWTGNIRQLRNVIERMIILSDEVITAQDIRAYAQEIL